MTTVKLLSVRSPVTLTTSLTPPLVVLVADKSNRNVAPFCSVNPPAPNAPTPSPGDNVPPIVTGPLLVPVPLTVDTAELVNEPPPLRRPLRRSVPVLTTVFPE